MDETRAALLEKLLQNYASMLEAINTLADAQHMIAEALTMPALAVDADGGPQTIQ